MVTSRLLEAFLACPVKCHLLSEGEIPHGTEYSAWAAERNESYRREGVRKLASRETGPCVASAEPGLWKRESWQIAVAKTVRAEGWEAEIALIQRIPQVGASSRFVPIRFAANNRLSASDKTMAAFEAISPWLGSRVGVASMPDRARSAGSLPAAFKASSAAVIRCAMSA